MCSAKMYEEELHERVQATAVPPVLTGLTLLPANFLYLSTDEIQMLRPLKSVRLRAIYTQ